MMKAFIYKKDRAGNRLHLQELNIPQPGQGEVLVRIAAVSINAADYRSMQLGLIPKGRIFGSDISGQVVSVGNNVVKLKIGESVLGDLADFNFGGFSEYVAAPEKAFVSKPSGLSFQEAAALPMAAVTALQGLRDKGCLQHGQKVLIYGACGGVGTFAVQLARYFGADITAVCGPANIDLIRSLGTDHVIDYSSEDFSLSGKKYDLILAVNGNRRLADYKRALASRGRFVLIGGSYSQIIRTLLLGWFLSLGGRRFDILAAHPNSKDLEWIAGLAEKGCIRPVIDRIFPFLELPDAVRYISSGHARGKVIVKVVDDQIIHSFSTQQGDLK